MKNYFFHVVGAPVFITNQFSNYVKRLLCLRCQDAVVFVNILLLANIPRAHFLRLCKLKIDRVLNMLLTFIEAALRPGDSSNDIQ